MRRYYIFRCYKAHITAQDVATAKDFVLNKHSVAHFFLSFRTILLNDQHKVSHETSYVLWSILLLLISDWQYIVKINSLNGDWSLPDQWLTPV
jgi:hypothetical protein